MEILQAWVTLIKDIITCLAALTAAVIAIMGLQTWKKQLRANAEYDLARRVLIAVYKVRDALNHFRMFAIPGEDLKLNNTKEFHDLRMGELSKAYESLNVELLEAEAVWGGENDYRMGFNLFHFLFHEVNSAYLQYYSGYEISDAVDPNAKRNAHALLFTNIGPFYKDEFSTRLENSVKRIEDVLRPKLTLKQGERKKKP